MCAVRCQPGGDSGTEAYERQLWRGCERDSGDVENNGNLDFKREFEKESYSNELNERRDYDPSGYLAICVILRLHSSVFLKYSVCLRFLSIVPR